MPELSTLNVLVRLYHRSSDWSYRSAHALSKNMNALDSERMDTSNGITLVRQNWPWEADFQVFMATLKHPKTMKIITVLESKGLSLDLISDWAYAPWAKNLSELRRAVSGARATADSTKEKEEEDNSGAGPSTPPPDTQDLLEGEGSEEEQLPVHTKKRKAALALGIASNYGKKQKK